MKFKSLLSSQMKSIILSTTTKSERKEVAEKNGYSEHTLNSIIRGDRNINSKNEDLMLDLIRLSITKAKTMEKSLINYSSMYEIR